MAPIPDPSVEAHLKTTIQTLFEIQSSIHGYLGPPTQVVLIRKIHELAASLAALSTASHTLSTTQLPPEIIDYIDQGRNPDIYNREFVEALARNNAFLKGKSEAFGGFRDCLAGEIVRSDGGLRGCVEGVLGGRRVADIMGEAERQMHGA